MRVTLILAALTLSACTPEAPDLTTVKAGRRAFAQDCVACHGTDGQGMGPMAAGIDPRPADLTRIAAHHGGTFPRDAVMSTINGYTSDRDRPMPHFHVEQMGDLVLVENADGTATPTPERLLALPNYLESIQE